MKDQKAIFNKVRETLGEKVKIHIRAEQVDYGTTHFFSTEIVAIDEDFRTVKYEYHDDRLVFVTGQTIYLPDVEKMSKIMQDIPDEEMNNRKKEV